MATRTWCLLLQLPVASCRGGASAKTTYIMMGTNSMLLCRATSALYCPRIDSSSTHPSEVHALGETRRRTVPCKSRRCSYTHSTGILTSLERMGVSDQNSHPSIFEHQYKRSCKSVQMLVTEGMYSQHSRRPWLDMHSKPWTNPSEFASVLHVVVIMNYDRFGS